MKKIIIVFIVLVSSAHLFGQEYTIAETQFESGTIHLFADIFIPKKTHSKKIGIALIQGSGDSGRTNLWAISIAEFLGEQGYYVLLPDKRGVGKAGGDWKNSSFQDLATDVIFSAHHLKEKMSLDKVGIMGLSQGGFIAPVAASTNVNIDFVISIVSASVTLEEQMIHEISNTARQNGLNPQEIVEVLELHTLMKEYVLNGDWTPLEKRFSELENATWSDFAKSFPRDPDHWIWKWLGLNINFNPIQYWKDVKQDTFIALGSKDHEDNVPFYESVYRFQDAFKSVGKENYEIKAYKTGHALYEENEKVLKKEFLQDVSGWLKGL